jgi:hypothetical protein
MAERIHSFRDTPLDRFGARRANYRGTLAIEAHSPCVATIREGLRRTVLFHPLVELDQEIGGIAGPNRRASTWIVPAVGVGRTERRQFSPSIALNNNFVAHRDRCSRGTPDSNAHREHDDPDVHAAERLGDDPPAQDAAR